MDTMLIFILALVVALIIGFVVVKLGGDRDNPASPTEAHEESDTGTEDGQPNIPRYPTGSRPGGPGLEAMNPSEAGDPSPGQVGDDAETADALKPSDAARKELGDDR
jgi:hypothetical protein